MKTLLQIISRLGAKRAKDNEAHKAKRYLPFPTEAEFAENPTKSLDAMAEAINQAAKDKKVNGTTLEENPETITGYAFPCKGPGKNFGEKVSRKTAYQWMKMGAALAHQQEMQDALFKKYGDASKKADNGEVVDDTEAM